MGQKGSCGGHVTQFWNIGTPWYLAETWNLARRRKAVSCNEKCKIAWKGVMWGHVRRTAESSNEKNAELGQKGVIWGSRDSILEFWDPLISRERLKLETSNFARRRTAVSSNENIQNWVKSGHVRVRWPNSGILGPPNISRAVEARNFKFGMQTENADLQRKNAKLGRKASRGGHVTQYWNFGTP